MKPKTKATLIIIGCLAIIVASALTILWKAGALSAGADTLVGKMMETMGIVSTGINPTNPSPDQPSQPVQPMPGMEQVEIKISGSVKESHTRTDSVFHLKTEQLDSFSKTEESPATGGEIAAFLLGKVEKNGKWQEEEPGDGNKIGWAMAGSDGKYTISAKVEKGRLTDVQGNPKQILVRASTMCTEPQDKKLSVAGGSADFTLKYVCQDITVFTGNLQKIKEINGAVTLSRVKTEKTPGVVSIGETIATFRIAGDKSLSAYLSLIPGVFQKKTDEKGNPYFDPKEIYLWIWVDGKWQDDTWFHLDKNVATITPEEGEKIFFSIAE